jgi:hypothetical protein
MQASLSKNRPPARGLFYSAAPAKRGAGCWMNLQQWRHLSCREEPFYSALHVWSEWLVDDIFFKANV